jgi:lipoate-protein ligase A
LIARLADRWDLRIDRPRDGATNMATDLALLDRARETGVATLRLYGWDRPTLSLGRNERAMGRFDAARLEHAGVAVVRRPTGGRALLHDREVTYSVTTPLDSSTAADAYRAINALLGDALARLGVSVTAAPRAGRPLRPEGAACFAEPAAGELVVGDAKLVGSAQVIEDDTLLQHGSILLDDDQSRIAELRAGSPITSRDAGMDANTALAPVATLRAALHREVAAAEVTAAIAEELEEAVTSVRVAESDEGISASVAALRARFTDPGWTWRR